ncbi:MAG: hypothetical protein CMH22_09680 [Methylophaga sp.]|uniref:hypothetical protein n=1 Tax=Methylophaga sp. UBA678 TaxID=1946901 RepID=UPI000C5CED8B|nr:hypothetical protein [Methylophaga sp. UBA678]MAX52237.1 hypothetical protein [Methylophaga sp.]|tara:strand:+ start:20214 stop:21104 length:891 start_codon:yes stop_codon:yes gene_type:complete
MAEDNNDILEEETETPPTSDDTPEREVDPEDNNTAKANSKDKPLLFGLSKSLLIKIGLGVAALLLITGLALFFLMDSSDTEEEAEPILLDAPTDSDNEDTDNLSSADEQSAVLPEVDINLEDDEEEGVVLPTVVKKQTDENGNVIPTENLIDPMPGDEPPLNENTASSEMANQQNNEADTLPSITTDSTDANIDGSSPDKLLKEVMALQQQLNKQQSTNQELIRQIQELSNENKSLKNEDLTASNYVAPAAPSFTDNNEAQSDNDKPIQYQDYRYSQQHKLNIGPQWGEVNPNLDK